MAGFIILMNRIPVHGQKIGTAAEAVNRAKDQSRKKEVNESLH
jgi:hypothetical protein